MCLHNYIQLMLFQKAPDLVSKGRFNFQMTSIIRPQLYGQMWARHCRKCSEMWLKVLEQLEMLGLAHKRLPGSQFAGLGRIKSWCNKHLAPRVCGRGDELMCMERLGPCS